MENDHPISEINRLFRFSDDNNLIFPEKINVCLLEEFDHIKKCENDKKMVFNLFEIKEILFKSPNPRLYLRPHPLDAIEQTCWCCFSLTLILAFILSQLFVANVFTY